MKNASIIVSHQISSSRAREDFAALVACLQRRSISALVEGANLDSNGESFCAAVEGLLKQGAVNIQVIPYFLHDGMHAQQDITAIIEKAKILFPSASFSMSEGLWHEPLVADALWEKITAAATDPAQLPQTGADIEALSHSIIDRHLQGLGFTLPQQAVVRRVIHSTADFSFARTLHIHPQAIENGVAAIRNHAPFFCDVTMVKQGMTKVQAEINCAISLPEVIEISREKGITRAAAAIDFWGTRLNGGVLVVGNAPTALWRLLEKPEIKPALVVGLPVGFVGAREAKQALIKSGHVCIANTTPRGGSPAAAAAVNALVLLADSE